MTQIFLASPTSMAALSARAGKGRAEPQTLLVRLPRHSTRENENLSNTFIARRCCTGKVFGTRRRRVSVFRVQYAGTVYLRRTRPVFLKRSNYFTRLSHSFMKSSTFLVCTSQNPGNPGHQANPGVMDGPLLLSVSGSGLWCGLGHGLD